MRYFFHDKYFVYLIVEKHKQELEKISRTLKQVDLYETQLFAQQKETKAAVETLQDAATEMEV